MNTLRNSFFSVKQINNSEKFFFFPYYHVGGAETVHLKILKIFNEKVNCFTTEKPLGTGFKALFEKHSNLMDIYPFTRGKFLRKVTLMQIAKKINACKNPVVFGCNSHFFYDLLPYLKPHVKKIDLLHAFSFGDSYASELYSLKTAHLLDHRIVLGEKTKNDYIKLYAENNISENLISRISIIKNYIDIPENKVLKNEKLKIIFVGRDSPEKRASIFFKIAEKAKENGIEADFLAVGNFDKNKYPHPENLTFCGEITDKNRLDEIYRHSHIILVTSSREGLPMVLLEGMSFGVVPISTNVGEIPEMINTENKLGFLVENAEDEKILVEKFIEKIKILQNDRELLYRFSENAVHFLKKNYGKKTFVEQYRKLLKN